MPLDLTQPGSLMFALLPDLVLAVGAMLLLLVAAWRPASAEHQRTVGIGALLVAVLTLAAVVFMGVQGYTAAPSGPIAVDRFRWAADAVVLLGVIFTLLMSVEYQESEAMLAGESHVLVLLATSGMMLLIAARDLTLVFLGIELMSISTYVLVATNRRSARSAEGALKYFLLGAFSTAFLLYGAALVYGATGSTSFAGIAGALAEGGLAHPLLKPGLALLVVGFGFKVAAAPFHMWAPDAYEGAPTPITSFMAATIKAASLAAFMRIFIEAFGAALGEWHFALWWLAAITMVVGNVVALAQKSLKRMLAYSSIAHAGYLLIAIVVGVGAGPTTGITGSGALLFYLFAYTLSTMGAFAVVSALGTPGDPQLRIEDLGGLWTVRPGLTLAMSTFMLALLGFPVFGGIGFFAKWYMIQAALRGGAAPQTRLAVVLVLTSVISAGYYLYVVAVMFMRPRAAEAAEPRKLGRLTGTVLTVAAALILIFGLAPTQVLRAMNRSALSGALAAPAAAVAHTP
jgi:NADH-quinone oxidoreductase subunit N